MKVTSQTKIPVKRRVRVRKGWHARFLHHLSVIPNILYATEKAGLNRVTVWNHRKADPEFERQVQEALDAGVQRLESRMHDHALNGVERGVWRNDADGKPVKVETVREFPYGMAQFLLKAHRPERYRDQAQVVTNVTTAVQQQVSVERPLERVASERLLELANASAPLLNGDGQVVTTRPIED